MKFHYSPEVGKWLRCVAVTEATCPFNEDSKHATKTGIAHDFGGVIATTRNGVEQDTFVTPVVEGVYAVIAADETVMTYTATGELIPAKDRATYLEEIIKPSVAARPAVKQPTWQQAALPAITFTKQGAATPNARAAGAVAGQAAVQAHVAAGGGIAQGSTPVLSNSLVLPPSAFTPAPVPQGRKISGLTPAQVAQQQRFLKRKRRQAALKRTKKGLRGLWKSQKAVHKINSNVANSLMGKSGSKSSSGFFDWFLDLFDLSSR